MVRNQQSPGKGLGLCPPGGRLHLRVTTSAAGLPSRQLQRQQEPAEAPGAAAQS